MDDEKASSTYLLKILSEYGKCDIANNGIKAVDAFLLAHEEGLPYDLISLDLMLPLFDGEDVLSAIRGYEDKNNIKASERVKIVITSALNDKELILKLIKHGIDKYFMKPVKAEKVIEYIVSL